MHGTSVHSNETLPLKIATILAKHTWRFWNGSFCLLFRLIHLHVCMYVCKEIKQHKGKNSYDKNANIQMNSYWWQAIAILSSCKSSWFLCQPTALLVMDELCPSEAHIPDSQFLEPEVMKSPSSKYGWMHD